MSNDVFEPGKTCNIQLIHQRVARDEVRWVEKPRSMRTMERV